MTDYYLYLSLSKDLKSDYNNHNYHRSKSPTRPFREFLNFKNLKTDVYSTKGIAELKVTLKEYIKIGGFPEAHLFGREMTSRIYSDIIYKDVIGRRKYN